MILFLRGLFIVVIISMLWVTGWASNICPLFDIPLKVFTHPWFIATMFDAYWGFMTFFVWVAYKQTSWFSKICWLIAILLLGNIAMASYWLAELFRVPRDGKISDILTTRRDGAGILGPVLAFLGIAIVVGAAYAKLLKQ